MRRVILAIVAGIVGMIIAPVIGPTLARLARPAVKTGIKTGLSLFRSGRVKLALLQEHLEDILAETRDELKRDVTEP